jgi:hypothetical protein
MLFPLKFEDQKAHLERRDQDLDFRGAEWWGEERSTTQLEDAETARVLSACI